MHSEEYGHLLHSVFSLYILQDFLEEYRKIFQDDFGDVGSWFLPEHEMVQELPSWTGGSYLAELEGFEKAMSCHESFGLKGK